MKRLSVILLIIACAISCVDRTYDLEGDVDMHATLLPGMTLDLGKEYDISVDTLFSLAGCRSVVADRDGAYRFTIPELRLIDAAFSDKELINGVTIDKSFMIKTHVDMPEILDSEASDFVLDRMLLTFSMNNTSPYSLVVEASVIIGDQTCNVSFTSQPGSAQSHEVSCMLRMNSLSTEFEIADIHIMSSEQSYKGDDSYRVGMKVQPKVPLSFAPGSILQCHFPPEVFTEQVIYEAKSLEFNYVVSNPSPFDLQFIFSVPQKEGIRMVMDRIPAGANNKDIKLSIGCNDYVMDRIDKVNISLQAVNSGDKYGQLRSSGRLKMKLKNVVFPEGIIIR